MLRSLDVLLGCAFVLRFIALESLYAPGRGLMKRVMTALMEGVTLGALEYEPAGAATGYVAFLALSLYLVGLMLMGAMPESSGRAVYSPLEMPTSNRRRVPPLPPSPAALIEQHAMAGRAPRNSRGHGSQPSPTSCTETWPRLGESAAVR